MLKCYTQTTTKEAAIPIQAITTKEFEQWLTKQKDKIKNWIKTTKFKAESGSSCLLLDDTGRVAQVLLGVKNMEDFWAYGALPRALPEGLYQITAKLTKENLERAALAWALGTYQFSLYKKQPVIAAKLALTKQYNLKKLEQLTNSIFLVRTLINTPTDDMGPAEIAEAVIKVADECGATVNQIIGDDLLKEGYTAIHAVGRASVHAPRLIDLRWGNPKHPKVTLVGKGVCFDSGGLDLKSADGMSTMKMDMGGAAHVLAIARMLMLNHIPIRLRVLIPTVENAVSGDAYHPGDVLATRKGITVEVTNTDAEGRLILCDVLAEGASEKPEILIDIATLTGAARVALGPDVAAMYATNDETAEGLLQWSAVEKEPIWRMPLHTGYRSYLDSQVADIVNASSSRYGGSITAALFLKEFVPDGVDWVHFDIMAANVKSQPGRPEGGEAMIVRTIYSFLEEKFK
ncbi:MAG: leucyl aminopeptidase family protein [Gammaproteobacteria bacterium]